MKKDYETFGNYILLEKLAAGGMAEVYLAKKLAAGGVQKFVAIKRILQQFSDSKDFIQMFKDEAKIAINLSHSNVVSIYDFGTEAEQFYIVMEFVEGRNLRQVLNRMKRMGQQFSIAQVAHIIKQVSLGLDHAHRCIDPTTGKPLNIIHRDMSPQNVMLGFEGDAKIVDFGIAKAAHQIEATRAGTLKGKFGYMSPEQVEGQSVDSRTDIFALGIMIWEMLANQRLFLANSEINTLRKIRECDVPSLRKINPNIPAELDQIVQKALEKDKLERYQSAADLGRDLQGFLSRFDPDFSVQDLSKFVKSLFSEEIIQIRKKQIIYAQVTVKNQEMGEKTHVVGQSPPIQHHTEEQKYSDDMSLDHISFHNISKSTASSVPFKKVSGDDYTQDMDNHTRAQQLHIAKRVAHEKVKEYKKSTFTNTEQTMLDIERGRNKSATLLTVIFSMSLLLAFLGYLNKFHPNFKSSFCKATESYGLCPKSIYIPANLLVIDSVPSGADIFVNGEKIGTGKQELIVQTLPIQVGVRKDGFKAADQVLQKVPESNELKFRLVAVPTGYLTIKSPGGQITVNGVPAKSGRKVSVPADSPVEVKVVNPFSGLSVTKYYTVKQNEKRIIVIAPPTSNNP